MAEEHTRQHDRPCCYTPSHSQRAVARKQHADGGPVGGKPVRSGASLRSRLATRVQPTTSSSASASPPFTPCLPRSFKARVGMNSPADGTESHGSRSSRYPRNLESVRFRTVSGRCATFVHYCFINRHLIQRRNSTGAHGGHRVTVTAKNTANGGKGANETEGTP